MTILFLTKGVLCLCNFFLHSFCFLFLFCFVLFCFVLFCFVLFCFVLFWFWFFFCVCVYVVSNNCELNIFLYLFLELKPECMHLGPVTSLESLPYEKYISILECQPDLAGVGNARKQLVDVRFLKKMLEGNYVTKSLFICSLCLIPSRYFISLI